VGSESSYALNWEASLFRTTIGHELGHVILHRDIAAGAAGGLMRCASSDMRSRPRSPNYDPVEYQANMMMAALLMPAEVFREAHTAAEITNDRDYDIINDLATDFDVSAQAVKIRLGELNLA
jgi:Zn-dependent peptidase ImmA (M78 family)